MSADTRSNVENPLFIVLFAHCHVRYPRVVERISFTEHHPLNRTTALPLSMCPGEIWRRKEETFSAVTAPTQMTRLVYFFSLKISSERELP